jgi:hypothetical protein
MKNYHLVIAALILIGASAAEANAPAYATEDFVGEAMHTAHQPTVADLATKYQCDEGKIFSINYVLGASSATFDGKQWRNVEIVATTVQRDGEEVNGVIQTEEIPATQYTFENKGTRLYFVTGKNSASAGALLLPNSDDLLYCEATK